MAFLLFSCSYIKIKVKYHLACKVFSRYPRLSAGCNFIITLISPKKLYLESRGRVCSRLRWRGSAELQTQRRSSLC